MLMALTELLDIDKHPQHVVVQASLTRKKVQKKKGASMAPS
jgi:hypothetical protein